MSKNDNAQYKRIIIDSFRKKNAKVCVVGLGYVGLPLSICFAEKDFKLLGIDIDIKKINYINSGKSYINHISSNIIETLVNKNSLIVSNDFKLVSECEAIILCLPTPLNEFREPDLSFIRNTLQSLIPFLRKGQALSLESTTYPGTTKEEILPLIESEGFIIGEDFFLIYSPEREDPGNDKFNTKNIPKLVSGITKNCLEVGVEIYSNIVSNVVQVKSTNTAEMTKLVENIHRAVNIGLMNELKPLSDEMGIDIYEVIRAASTKPFGFVPYYPGPGLGGHCLPIDPFYLTWKARQFGMHTHFIELAGEINTSMPYYVVSKIVEGLNQRKKAINGSRVLLLGLSYKKNVDDMRESPSIKIIHEVIKKGGLVDYCDPYFPSFPKIRKYVFNLKSIQLSAKNISMYDVVVISTDHDIFDYQLIKNYSQLIIDTRGRYSPCENIIRA